MSDVLKILEDMQNRFYEEFGDLNKGNSQHEKHLTWMSGFYAEKKGLKPSTETEKPYFSQEYNNHTFTIGYRIGRAELKNEYDKGYEDGRRDAEFKLRDALGLT